MKQVTSLLVALIISLGASYWTWTRPDVELNTQSEVNLYELSDESQLQSLTWSSEAQIVLLTKKSDKKGEYFWIDQTQRYYEAPEKVEPEPDDVPPPFITEIDDSKPDPGELKERHNLFLGNQRTPELWSAFVPLHSLRRLPTKGRELKDFGLDEPRATLTVKRATGSPVEMLIGAHSFGKRYVYVGYRDAVWLVKDETLRTLEHSISRLRNRATSPLLLKDIHHVEINYKGNTYVFHHQNPKKDVVFWSTPEKPNKPDNAAGTWIEKLQRLSAASYVQESDDPVELTPLVTVTQHSNEGVSWKNEFFIADDDTLYAKSEYGRGTLQFTKSLGRGFVRDLEGVFSEDE